MSKFKVGDKIRIKPEYYGLPFNFPEGFSIDHVFTVACIDEAAENIFLFDGRQKGNVCLCGKHCWVVKFENIIKINKELIMSSLIEKFSLAFTSEPEKSFIKTGITNSNGNGLLTEDGERIFLSWLLKKNGDEFKSQVVDPILAEKAAE